jgi:hypothetical protein
LFAATRSDVGVFLPVYLMESSLRKRRNRRCNRSHRRRGLHLGAPLPTGYGDRYDCLSHPRHSMALESAGTGRCGRLWNRRAVLIFLRRRYVTCT